MKRLIVDRIVESGNTGVTENRDTICYNCNLINDKIVSHLTDQLTTSEHATTVKIAGRYLCIITLSLSDKSIMVIKNLRRDESELNDIIGEDSDREYVEILKSGFQALKNDDKGYYDFELEIGGIAK